MSYLELALKVSRERQSAERPEREPRSAAVELAPCGSPHCAGCSPMPEGVRLVRWKLKEPPIAMETCTVVTDPARFASTTLAQLKAALANPGRWVGWSVPQLIDRLAQVGVTVALEIDKS